MPSFGPFKMEEILSKGWTLDPVGTAAKHSTRAASIDWELFHEFAKHKRDFGQEWQKMIFMDLSIVIVSAIFIFFAVVALALCCFFLCGYYLLGWCKGVLTAEEIREQSLIEFAGLCLLVLSFIAVLSVMVLLMITCTLRINFVQNLAFQSANDTVNDTITYLNDAHDRLVYLLGHSETDYFVKKTSGVRQGLLSTVSQLLFPVLHDFDRALHGYTSACDRLENMLHTDKTFDSLVQAVADAKHQLGNIANRADELKNNCTQYGFNSKFCTSLPSSAGIVDPTWHINMEEVRTISSGFPSEYLRSARSVRPTISPADMIEIYTQDLAGKYADELDTYLKEIGPELAESVKVSLEFFSKEVGTHFSNIQEHIVTLQPLFTDYLTKAKPYFTKVQYTMAGLTILLLMAILMVFLGLLCSFMGVLQPSLRGTRSSLTIKGYNILLCSMSFSFFVAFVLCLAACGSLLLNSQLTMFCKTFENLEMFEEVLDNSSYFSLDKTVFEMQGFAEPGPSIKSILSSCKNGSSVFDALNINLDAEIAHIKDSIHSKGTFRKITVDGIGSQQMKVYGNYQAVITKDHLSILLTLDAKYKAYLKLQSGKNSSMGLKPEDVAKLKILVNRFRSAAMSALTQVDQANYNLEYQKLAAWTTDILTSLKPKLDRLRSKWDLISQTLLSISVSGLNLLVPLNPMAETIIISAPKRYRQFTQALTEDMKTWESDYMSYVGHKHAFWLLLVLAAILLELNVVGTVYASKHFRKADDEKEFLYRRGEELRIQDENAAEFEATMITVEIVGSGEDKEKRKGGRKAKKGQKGIDRIRGNIPWKKKEVAVELKFTSQRLQEIYEEHNRIKMKAESTA